MELRHEDFIRKCNATLNNNGEELKQKKKVRSKKTKKEKEMYIPKINNY